MKKIYPVWLTIYSLFFLTSATSLFAFSAAYDQEVTVNGNPIAAFKVVLQDKSMKASTNLGGVDTQMLRNETGTYNYVPSQNQATKLPDDVRPNITDELPHYMDFLTKNNAKNTGTETIGTYECDIYEFVDPNTKANSKAWVWKEKQFPIRIEVNAPEGLTAVQFKNVELGQTIDVKEFAVPEGTKIITYEEAVKQAQEEMQKAAAQAPPVQEQPAAPAGGTTPTIEAEEAPAAPAAQ